MTMTDYIYETLTKEILWINGRDAFYTKAIIGLYTIATITLILGGVILWNQHQIKKELRKLKEKEDKP